MKKPLFFFTHYLIMYYVSDSKRGIALNNLLRSYAYQQQRAVFEAEITPSQLERLKEEILKIIDRKKDNVIIIPLCKHNILAKEVFGKLKYRVQRIF